MPTVLVVDDEFGIVDVLETILTGGVMGPYRA